MTDHLFVFGTLLSGYDHPMARLLADSGDLIGKANCQGRLHLVSHYPGMIASDAAADRVFGELYRLKQPDETLRILDDYEGCGENDAEPFEFLRRMVTVTLADGTAQAAWTYYYNRPVAHLPRIMSGRFLEY